MKKSKQKIASIEDQSELDRRYSCVMQEPPAQPLLTSETFEFNGYFVNARISKLFVMEDGSVYVVMGRGKTRNYISVKELGRQLLEAAKAPVLVSVSLWFR